MRARSPSRTGRSRPTPPSTSRWTCAGASSFHHLKGVDNGVDTWPPLRYFNLAEETYHESDVWPPEGTRRVRFWPARDGGLTLDDEEAGSDRYVVDPGVTTGPTNRWATQLGGPVLGLHDRAEMSDRMLCYTTLPLEEDLQVTGRPVVRLTIRSEREDAVLLCYLQDVDPEGRVRYVTEGGLRALHRKPAEGRPGEAGEHSFARADAAPLVPGEPTELTVPLWPTSVLFQEGHSIQLAIAGADEGTFEPLFGPEAGETVLEVLRGGGASFLELPVVGSGSEGARR